MYMSLVGRGDWGDRGAHKNYVEIPFMNRNFTPHYYPAS